jgi:two-component system sensor histidine kinase BaeS
MGSRSNEKQAKNAKAPEHFALLAPDLTIIAGKIKVNDPLFNRPLFYNQHLVAYLHVEPFIKLTDELDHRFVQNQQQAVIKIALFALLLSLIATWIIAYYLRGRLLPLTRIAQDFTQHDYRAQISVKHKDELGQLATDLNLLGRTLEQNQTARQQWIADISHELRTPLSILKGELEAIEDDIRPLNKHAIASLAKEVERLKKLVDDLFQLSLSDLGALQYTSEAIDLTVLLVDITNNFKTRFKEKSLCLINRCDPQKTLLIKGDRNRLYQLFSNLFENSYRYTNKKGQIQLDCSAKNGKIMVRISDSAPNLPNDQLTKIFDRLHRVEASRNRKTGGAGLGLTIAKTIVEAHAGTIYAMPSSLGGIMLTIEIPEI